MTWVGLREDDTKPDMYSGIIRTILPRAARNHITTNS